jgi:hypothetical protein
LRRPSSIGTFSFHSKHFRVSDFSKVSLTY